MDSAQASWNSYNILQMGAAHSPIPFHIWLDLLQMVFFLPHIQICPRVASEWMQLSALFKE